MFSSLEALDAQDDALGALPVARQGAFQPKAKPRARKVGASAPASLQKPNDAPSPRKADGAVSHAPAGQLDRSVDGRSALRADVDHRNRVADSAHSTQQAAVCIDVASAADEEPAPQETAVGSDEGAHRPFESTVFPPLGRETVPAPPALPANVIHNQIQSDLETVRPNLNEADPGALVTSSHDEVYQEVEENADDVVPPKLKNAGDTISPEENVLETACQDIDGQLDTVLTRKRKKARVKRALPKETVLETCGDDTETVPLNKSSNQASRETSKRRQGRLSVFAAVASAVSPASPASQPGVEIAANRSSVSEPAIVEEGQKQKRLKKSTLRKKKVERRAVDLAEPDLDPKKLTMKQIIRLAQAKERKSKEGTARKANDSSQITQADGQAEQEHQQNERMAFAPQVQIIDGRIVINQESLSISAHPVNDMRQYKRVEETHSKLNYHSYVKRTPKQVWKYEETELFYKGGREDRFS